MRKIFFPRNKTIKVSLYHYSFVASSYFSLPEKQGRKAQQRDLSQKSLTLYNDVMVMSSSNQHATVSFPAHPTGANTMTLLNPPCSHIHLFKQCPLLTELCGLIKALLRCNRGTLIHNTLSRAQASLLIRWTIIRSTGLNAVRSDIEHLAVSDYREIIRSGISHS